VSVCIRPVVPLIALHTATDRLTANPIPSLAGGELHQRIHLIRQQLYHLGGQDAGE
jgi:hypothetical protein